MLAFRVGLAGIKGIEENQIEAHGFAWGDVRIIQYLANNEQPAAWREGGPHVLEDLVRLVGREHLQEFAHNRDLIGPGHGTANDIGRVDRDAVRRSRLRDHLGRDGGHGGQVHHGRLELGVRLGQGHGHPPRTATHIHEGAGRGKVIARSDFLRRGPRRHVDAPQEGVSELWICYPLTDEETSQSE